MIETKITCDGCGEPIVGRNGYPINDYIVLGKRDIAMKHTQGVYLISMQPKLDREYQFHGISCLSKWKKIEEAQEKALTNEKD